MGTSGPSLFSGPRRNLSLFVVAIVLTGAAGGLYETIFNNYLNDAFAISAVTRGRLEFPRELPGFLTALFAGLLFFVPEAWIGAVAALAVAAGMFGMAIWGMHWGPMVGFMVLWSCGAHLSMPVRSSLGLAMATRQSTGRRLGQIAGAGTASALIGCGLVWLIFRASPGAYRLAFAVGGVLAAAGAVAYALMRMPDAHLRRPQFVWRREYHLYYVLAVLFGARKQIFITFGPWVLVRVFNQPPEVFAVLGIAGALAGMVFQPWLGVAIDRFGERRVLMADAVCILAVCLGYGFADRLPTPRLALWLLYACYVGDMLLFGVNMARATYLSKIAVRREDIAPSLGLEVTVNHIVSMSVPTLGGLAWARWGHASVFLGAGGVALLMLLCTSRIRLPAPR
jgi:hypothetical protein